ncbi:hypothetical protein GCM10023350_27190 [Nocardioides endophyticus]|uniref:Ig-like domain-containing protein n=1 Tax=Nocardioides endophyticus TaxID=1353775 RepID=A0ABP8YXC9_9ACTN
MSETPTVPEGASKPAYLQRWWSRLCVLTLLLGTLGFVTASPASAEEIAITEGTVTWGLKQSWRTYIGEAGTTVSGGVTRAVDGAFVWPVESGAYDDSTKTLELDLGGSAHFEAHEGALDLTISGLKLVIDGETQALFGKLQSKNLDTGAMVDYGLVPLADIDLDSGAPTVTGGTTTWTPLTSYLAPEAAKAFAGFYGSGIAIDPVSMTYTGPGGKPVVTKESWDAPATLVYEEIGTAAPIQNATAIMPDSDRNIVHVATSTDLRAYAADTMEPLGAAVTPGQSSYPTPILDEYSGAVVANSGGKLKAFTWNTATNAYDVTVISETPMYQFSYDPNSALTWGFNGEGIYYWISNGDGTWYVEKFAMTGLPNGRVGFAVDSSWTAIFATAGSQPFAVDVTHSPLQRTALPDDYLNPTAAQAFYGYPTEAEAPAGGGFVLSNYQGQVYTVKRSDGAYRLVGAPKITGGNQVLRGTLDSDTGTTYLVDYGMQRLTAVKGDSVGIIPVKDLGIDSITPIAASADGGVVYAASYRGGAGSATYGLHRYRQIGVTPAVTSQPKSTTGTLAIGQETDTASFEVDGSLIDSIQWQTRAGASGKFADMDGETSKKLTVTVTKDDQGRQYRAKVTNQFGAMVSDAAILTVNTAPVISVNVSSTAVGEGADALFEVMPGGNPYPNITWQRRVGGFWEDIKATDVNYRVDGGRLTVRGTNLEQDGTLFRAQLSNVVDTIFTKSGKLTVSPKMTIPEDGLDLEGVSLDWTGSEELQSAPPAGGSNYFSAGKSNGDEASYKAADGNVKVQQLSSIGAESAATYATRAAHVSNGGSQLVRLSDGEAKVEADGSATVEWEGSWSVNFYGGMVPFTVTDPELEVDKDGRGTLKADLSGYASSMEDPEVKTPLDLVQDVTIATFSDVEIDPAGKVIVDPDYAGVELTVPDGQTPQKRTGDGWGSWPQGFVDFHVATGLSSYWYSSGGAADSKKPPTPFVVDFTDAETVDGPSVRAPQITGQPGSKSALVGSDVTLSVTASGDDLSYRWQKRIGSLWIDLPDETDATLKLTDVVAEDAGSYRVRLTNSAGSVTSSTATLTAVENASTLTITAPSATTFGKAATVVVNVPDRTGQVTLAGVGPAKTAMLAAGKATFELPKTLVARGYILRASYAGDARYAGVSARKKLTVKRASVSFTSLTVTDKPTSKKAGKASVVLESSTGATVTGKAMVTVKKGRSAKKVTVTVKNGKAIIKLPKLKKGAWKISVSYLKSTNFNAKTKTTTVKTTE